MCLNVWKIIQNGILLLYKKTKDILKTWCRTKKFRSHRAFCKNKFGSIAFCSFFIVFLLCQLLLGSPVDFILRESPDENSNWVKFGGISEQHAGPDHPIKEFGSISPKAWTCSIMFQHSTPECYLLDINSCCWLSLGRFVPILYQKRVFWVLAILRSEKIRRHIRTDVRNRNTLTCSSFTTGKRQLFERNLVGISDALLLTCTEKSELATPGCTGWGSTESPNLQLLPSGSMLDADLSRNWPFAPFAREPGPPSTSSGFYNSWIAKSFYPCENCDAFRMGFLVGIEFESSSL